MPQGDEAVPNRLDTSGVRTDPLTVDYRLASGQMPAGRAPANQSLC